MTSTTSQYFQGRVIETNEPCYISWDTESCCSKIHSQIELKLEASILSTDLRSYGTSEKQLFQGACCTCPSLLLFQHGPFGVFVFFLANSKYIHGIFTTIQPSHIIFQAVSSRCREQKSHYLIHTVPLANSLLIREHKHFLHASFILNATKCSN